MQQEAAGQAWLDGVDEPHRRLAAEVAGIVAGADPRLQRAVKWRRLTFTVGGDWHHWLCAVAATKAGVRLVFHKGALLADPGAVLTGSARYVRELPGEEVIRRPQAVRALVAEAIRRQTAVLGRP